MAAAAASSDWSNDRSAAGAHSPWLVASVVALPTFMEVLDISIANVALRHIAGALSVTYDESTWILTSYLVSNAIVIPMSGWLSDVLGRKRYYMTSVALFVCASLLCGMAPSLALLVVARILQGLAGGGMQPTTQAILIDTFPPERRGRALALFGVTVILAPAIGPVIGGWITDSFSWRWVFLINVPVGLLALTMLKIFIAEPKLLRKERAERWRRGISIDGWGILLIAAGLGFLELTLDRGQREDWFSSCLIVTATIVSVASLIGFVICELARREPLLDLRMFKHRNFAIAMSIILATGVILFGTIQFLPQLLQQVFDYSATDAGLAMTLGGAVTLVVMPMAGILSDHVPPRYLVSGALIAEGLALWHMTHINTNISFQDAAMLRTWVAIGIPFLFLPLMNAAYVGLPPNRSNQASALLNIGRNLGGTIGISIIQTVLARRQQFHQSRLVEALNPLNPVYAETLRSMTHALMAQGQSQFNATQLAMAQLYHATLRQATMLSFIDGFWVLLAFVICVFPLSLLLRSRPLGGRQTAATDVPREMPA